MAKSLKGRANKAWRMGEVERSTKIEKGFKKPGAMKKIYDKEEADITGIAKKKIPHRTFSSKKIKGAKVKK